MHNILVTFAFFIAMLVCIVVAFKLIMEGLPHWGWFLFAAILFGSCLTYINTYSESSDQDEAED